MENQEGTSTPPNILEIWRAAKGNYTIEDYDFSIKTDVKDLPAVSDWCSFIKFLDAIAQPVCSKHHNWMIDQFMKIRN